jgi:hypothetical protein
MSETLCDAAASAQTAQCYRDFCAFAKIWEPTSARKWRRNKYRIARGSRSYQRQLVNQLCKYGTFAVITLCVASYLA